MEIDRIQSIQGLKVERTGSEQERRRRRQTEEDFSDLLESSMSEESSPGRDQDKPKEQETPLPPTDTISLSSNQLPAPYISDLVSISATAKVGAEMHHASRSVEKEEVSPQVDILLLESKLEHKPPPPAPPVEPPAAPPAETTDPAEPPPTFDTIA